MINLEEVNAINDYVNTFTFPPTLFVIATNNTQGANSRRSYIHAAARWEADLIRIVSATEFRCTIPGGPEEVRGFLTADQTALLQSMHPAAGKTAVFELFHSVDRVLILDADMVISREAPNPFTAFPAPPLGVVANGNHRFGDLAGIKQAEAFEWHKVIARWSGPAQVPASYFNSGFLLADRAHHQEMFARARAMCQEDLGLGWIDQTPLNYARLAFNVPVNLLDETWNFIHPETLGPDWRRMKKHLYHFAGTPNRAPLIESVVW